MLTTLNFKLKKKKLKLYFELKNIVNICIITEILVTITHDLN